MTAGRIILPEADPSLDRDGNPLSKAKLYFYQKGTTTPQPVYTDSTLGVALSNPVLADGAGRFAQMWADISAVFDVKWTDTNDALIRTFANIAALTTAVAPDGSGIVAADFRDALGLGTAALEDTGVNGHVLAFLDGDNNYTGTQNFTAGVQRNGHEMGYRDLPTLTENVDYTFDADDAGQRKGHTSASPHTWTIPPSTDVTYDLGATIVLRNRGTGVVTIARGIGVALRIVGESTDQNVTLAAWGMATLIQDAPDIWCIAGKDLAHA